jgi:hypothetical protein
MKYEITDKQLDKLIFHYLDNQDFIIVGNGLSLFFINSEGDESAQIRYNKDDGWCYINHDLIREINTFFSMKTYDTEKIISKWVEYVLDMDVTNIGKPGYVTSNTLYYSI